MVPDGQVVTDPKSRADARAAFWIGIWDPQATGGTDLWEDDTDLPQWARAIHEAALAQAPGLEEVTVSRLDAVLWSFKELVGVGADGLNPRRLLAMP